MKTKTKLISAITVLCLASQCIAQDTCDNRQQGGLYAGIGLGESFHSILEKDVRTKSREKIRKNSHAVGLFIGYDHIIADTPLFVGAEAGAINHNMSKTIDASTYAPQIYYKVKATTNNSANAAIRLGVVIDSALIYGKIGVSMTNYKVSFPGPVMGEHISKYKKYGKLFGAGIECKLNKNFSLGIEHVYVKYSSLTNPHPKVPLKFCPSANMTSGRLIYRF